MKECLDDSEYRHFVFVWTLCKLWGIARSEIQIIFLGSKLNKINNRQHHFITFIILIKTCLKTVLGAINYCYTGQSLQQHKLSSFQSLYLIKLKCKVDVVSYHYVHIKSERALFFFFFLQKAGTETNWGKCQGQCKNLMLFFLILTAATDTALCCFKLILYHCCKLSQQSLTMSWKRTGKQSCENSGNPLEGVERTLPHRTSFPMDGNVEPLFCSVKYSRCLLMDLRGAVGDVITLYY